MTIDFGRLVQAAKGWLPLVFGLCLLGVLWNEARALDWVEVQAAFLDIPVWKWVAALAATGVSFWAVGQYDVVAHRHLRTGRPELPARCAGAASIAVGQSTGFGPVVGAALRWRMMPDMSHGSIIHLTGFVTVWFFLCWALLAVTVALPMTAGLWALSLVALPLGVACVVAMILRYPRLKIFGNRLQMPSLLAFAKMLGLAAFDVIFAGLALYLLFPAEAGMSLALVIAAFTLAVGAGMLSGTPGGVGPFELALLAALQSGAPAEAAAAILAFRLVYYAIPLLMGTAYVVLARPHVAAAMTAVTPFPAPRLAEHGIAAQADWQALRGGEAEAVAEAVALRTPHSLTLFRGPTRGGLTPLLAQLRAGAAEDYRVPCLYKIDARDAVAARSEGWFVARLADEAVIDPRAFTLTGAPRRQLRRFLRKAETAGVTFSRVEHPDWAAMAEIHRAWEDAHGAERGLTMGRFCPLYLQDKPIFGAYLENRLIAYASFVEAPGAMGLDLMRYGADTPSGVMHGLIHAAIEDARTRGLAELGLAAVPNMARFVPQAEAAGLLRFKASFAPAWRPLYIAAPTLPELALAAVDLRLAITRPPPLVQSDLDLWRIDALLDRPAPAAPLGPVVEEAEPEWRAAV